MENKLTKASKSLPASLKASDCINGQLVKDMPEAEQFVSVQNELVAFLEASMIPFTKNQLAYWITDILRRYQSQTIEDIVMVLRKARQGEYGPIYKNFDMGKYATWMNEWKITKERIRQKYSTPKPWDAEEYKRRVNNGVRINEIVAEQKRKRRLNDITGNQNQDVGGGAETDQGRAEAEIDGPDPTTDNGDQG